MKKYFLFLILFIATNSCVFEECDGVIYQIKSKTDLGSGLCQYRAESVGDCLIWNDQKFIFFTDSCKSISISQTFKRDYLYKKYGI